MMRVTAQPQLLYSLRAVGKLVGKSYRAMIKEKQRGKIEVDTDAEGRISVRQDQLIRYLEKRKDNKREASESYGVEAFSRAEAHLTRAPVFKWEQAPSSKAAHNQSHHHDRNDEATKLRALA
jgi:hypothetical protein